MAAPRWYQEATVGGVAMPAQRRHDTSARRWAELVAPLLPPEGRGRLLVDLGCAEGYYSRQAAALGYRTVAVERDPAALGRARWWEQQEPAGVRLVEADLRQYTPPACAVALLANVHYWLAPGEWGALLARLRERALYLLVVGRHAAAPVHASPPDEGSLRRQLAGWSVEDVRRTARHYALRAANPRLLEADTAALFARQPFTRSRRFLPALRAYVDLVLARRRFALDHTALWAYAARRRWVHKAYHLRRLRHLILDARRDGYLATPLAVGADGCLVDGNFRLIIAERLGIERVICRRTA